MIVYPPKPASRYYAPFYEWGNHEEREPDAATECFGTWVPWEGLIDQVCSNSTRNSIRFRSIRFDSVHLDSTQF